MVEKITYEEALVEKLTKAMKEVVEQLNADSLIDSHLEKKIFGEEQKVSRPKAENVSEKNPVGGVISKAPPIPNPRQPGHATRNENMNRYEARKLFERMVDPELKRRGKGNILNYHDVDYANKLGMTSQTALKWALALYEVQEHETADRKEGEYRAIEIKRDDLVFHFE